MRVYVSALAIAFLLPSYAADQPAATPPATQAQPQDKDPLVCKTLPPAGATRIAKSTCMKQSAWDKLSNPRHKTGTPAPEQPPAQ